MITITITQAKNVFLNKIVENILFRNAFFKNGGYRYFFFFLNRTFWNRKTKQTLKYNDFCLRDLKLAIKRTQMILTKSPSKEFLLVFFPRWWLLPMIF
jgi:hypothetical protein